MTDSKIGQRSSATHFRNLIGPPRGYHDQLLRGKCRRMGVDIVQVHHLPLVKNGLAE
ncbi:MAG: hypothetical protein ABSD99_12560 [Candidatus Bathyarchaeia archaeon]